MDFDPRDSDSRDDERLSPRDFYEIRHLDDDARPIGRGPGNSRDSDNDDRYDTRDDARWPDRERDNRERSSDARESFARNLDLPRGPERELVRDRDREYTVRGSETRTLATVGAFRVVSSRDLRDNHDRPLDPRSGDLRHLREQGLVETVRIAGSREYTVALTKEGQSLLERHRDRDHDAGQTFWHGVKRERELEHDVQVYRAYEREAERLGAQGARVDRVVLDLRPLQGVRAARVERSQSAAATTRESTAAGDSADDRRPQEAHSVTANGKDITDRIIDLQSGLTSIVVTLTDQPTKVSGTVRDAQGEASPTAIVVAFPVDRTQRSGYGASRRNLKSALTTSTGVYTFDHLPSGEYEVIAIEPTEADDWQDPAPLNHDASRASRDSAPSAIRRPTSRPFCVTRSEPQQSASSLVRSIA